MHTADRIREILSSRGVSLYHVSQRSAEIYGRTSPYFVPQSLYHDISARAQAPDIHQLAALSAISNYCLCDWLAVFGFSLDDISRLQILTQWRNTALLVPNVYDEMQQVPWFREAGSDSIRSEIVPLSIFVKPSRRRAGELLAANTWRFLYARVGQTDLFAFPHLAPGSLVRIDARKTERALASLGAETSASLFLVETPTSFHCGHLRRTGRRHVLLCTADFPYTQLEIVLDKGTRILGVVDAELRPMLSGKLLPPAGRSPSPSKATLQPKAALRGELQQLLRSSRMRLGMSFRDASATSREIARILGDPLYFAAAGTLSDYENESSPLHHLPKIISLCSVYRIDFWQLLRAGGIQVEGLGQEAMSDELLSRDLATGRSNRAVPEEIDPQGPMLLSGLAGAWEEVPIFIRGALAAIVGIKDFSLSDIYWIGGIQNPIHPGLIGASLVAVNRRVRTPPRSAAATQWEQPLFMILKRDGSFLCAACELQDGFLAIHPHSEKLGTTVTLRNGIDAEVVGQVTAILRKLP